MPVEHLFHLSCDICGDYVSWNGHPSYAGALGLAKTLGWNVYDITDPDSKSWKYACHLQCPDCYSKNREKMT